MRIFVDFDDTIVDSVENVIRIANNRYGQKVTINDITRWSFDGVYDGVDEQDIVNIFYEDDFFKTLKIKNHAIVTLSKLSARNEIIIATKTTPKGFEKKYKWMKQNLKPVCKHIDILGFNLQQMKYVPAMEESIMIDDNVQFLKESKALYQIFYNNHRPFDATQEWDGLEVDNWFDLEVMLKDILRKEKGFTNGKV